MAVDLVSAKLPHPTLAFDDAAFVSMEAFEMLAGGAEAAKSASERGLNCNVGSHVFRVKPHKDVGASSIALGTFQRNAAAIALDTPIPVKKFVLPDSNFIAGVMEWELNFLAREDASRLSFDGGVVSAALKEQFSGHVYAVGQKVALQVKASDGREKPVSAKLLSFEPMSLDGEEPGGDGEGGGEGMRAGGGGKAGGKAGRFGQLLSSTDIMLRKAEGEAFKLSGGSASRRPKLFSKGFDFSALGVGGVSTEFKSIFRQVFSSRLLPPALVESMGLIHTRGLLLYGPPGCGKTLIARQIGKALHAREPKIVNGPEILNKYVGQSEENIRALFAEAEKEQAERGDDSELHVIILDEIDSICRKRGSVGGGTGVHDSVVNQLLSKIDGVEALDNIILIGMTNRKDMLDEALLRPGRLEVHVEIGLPDETGRQEILKIHTEKIRKGGFIGSDFDIPELAEATKNFTGAELARVVRNARSFALARVIDPRDLTKAIDPKSIVITQSDFLRAIHETTPKFGARDDNLAAFFRSGIIPHGPDFRAVENTLARLVRQAQHSERQSLLTVCLSGPPGSGKTALSARIASESGFPFVKRVGPEDMLAMGEAGKCVVLTEAFDDAYRTPLGLIVLDDIERMMDYVPIGPRFANGVLQTLLVLLRRQPPVEGRRLLVIATTSEPAILEDMGLLAAFTSVQTLPVLREPEQFKAVLDVAAKDIMEEDQRERAAQQLAERRDGIPVKRLLALVDMAAHADDEPEGDPKKTPTKLSADQLLLCALESGVH